MTSTLGVLRSATVIRFESGEHWGWEGQHIGEGSCEGSCTHVWNYQQVVPFLFPRPRTKHARGGFRPQPVAGDRRDGVPSPPSARRRASEYRSVRRRPVRQRPQGLSRLEKSAATSPGCERLWPRIRLAIDYAWSPGNPDRWDPEKTGGADRQTAPYARHGAVRTQLLADRLLSRGADGGGGDGGSRWR